MLGSVIPEWIIHRLGASELRQLADAYNGIANYFMSRAEQLDRDAALSTARKAAVQTRKQNEIERDREICRLYRAGLTDADIAGRCNLSDRQVRRVTAKMRQARRRPPREPLDTISTTPAATSAQMSHLYLPEPSAPSPGNGSSPPPNTEAEIKLPLAS